jgi:hypothetical protein
MSPDDAPVGVALGILGSLVALGGISAVVFAEVGREEKRLTVMRLVLGLQVVLIIFSSAYYVVESARPEEFVSLNTRLDALYFSITTAATVGFGDVHAAGQLARGMVTAHIAFNLVFLGAFAGLVREQVTRRRELDRERRHHAADPES